jgi:hypothetical protein
MVEHDAALALHCDTANPPPASPPAALSADTSWRLASSHAALECSFRFKYQQATLSVVLAPALRPSKAVATLRSLWEIIDVACERERLIKRPMGV